MAFQVPKLDRFSLQVTIHIKEENVPKLFKEMETVYHKVIADSECVYFELFQDPENPGTISWVENWDKSTEQFTTVCRILYHRYQC